jgi:hypothetical protein
VQNLLQSADGYSGQSHSGLHIINKSHHHEENINPNKHPYRYMWQAANTKVLVQVRKRQKLRSAWNGLVCMMITGFHVSNSFLYTTGLFK